MAASNQDKLRKLSRKWVGQIGSGGVSDAVVTTIPLASTTNLATDTAVTLVIDRVDSAGVKTPNKEETIVGVVSGSNIVNSVRGVEGTAQAHDAGAVVEVLVTADGYNDIIDHLLVGHLQDGRHSGSAITASNIAASAITSGTIAASAVVAGNLAASSVVAGNLAASSVSEGNLNFTASLLSTTKYLQQGVLLNGTLSVSVASNNLTVALKGMDGNDPSASNPVYVRIGDTVRTCTAALSVTKNAGTNWFNSGAAQHATYSNDYFVYLIWNTTPATDILDIGFARVPYGKTYTDFSGTSTAETYLATGNASAPQSTDELQVIGRFSAVLSATASFNWSAVTDIIVRPIYRTKWTKYNPTITWTAGLAPATVSFQESKFIINEDMCQLDLGYVYNSAGTTVTKVSVPVPIAKNNALQSGYDIQPGGMSNAFAPVATMSQWTTGEAFAMWCSSSTIDRFGVTTFYQIK